MSDSKALDDVINAMASIRDMPDPIVEVRITEDALSRLTAWTRTVTRTRYPEQLDSAWGIPLIVDNDLPSEPGWKIIRRCRAQ